MKNLLEERKRRLLILIFLATAVGALILLSSGLSSLELERGAYLVPERTSPPPADIQSETDDTPLRTPPQPGLVEKLARVLFWVLIPLALYVFIFESDDFLKRVVATLTGLIGLLLVLKMLSDMEIDQIPPQITPQATQRAGTPIAPPEPGTTSTSLIFTLSFLVILALLIAAFFFYRQVRSELSTEEKIKQQAREALQDISRGAEIENTILRCYHRMSQVLAEQQGISRKASMTPREFEGRLARAGFPEEHISTLTRLFEKVRYGGQQVSSREEELAIRCLERIIDPEDRP